MSPLERLGLEVAAFQLLGSRMKSATLCALIHAKGRPLESETLANARQWIVREYGADPKNVVKTRICLLRESLEDVGLPNVVTTHRGGAYALPEPGRTQVIERLLDTVA